MAFIMLSETFANSTLVSILLFILLFVLSSLVKMKLPPVKTFRQLSYNNIYIDTNYQW